MSQTDGPQAQAAREIIQTSVLADAVGQEFKSKWTAFVTDDLGHNNNNHLSQDSDKLITAADLLQRLNQGETEIAELANQFKAHEDIMN